jgi:two-component system chemotaxis response regulator CheY
MKRRLCLVVDDSLVVRKVARNHLKALGFDVDEAENGKVALEKCAATMPDVILLDWNMPVMNGVEFLRSLRSQEGGTTPRVVFCTVEDDAKHIEDAREAGANGYIVKPFDAMVIRAKLDPREQPEAFTSNN